MQVERIIRNLPLGVWLVAITSAVLMSGFGMVVPLLPVYGERLGASAFELGLLMGAFFVGRLVAQIPAGMASDRVGRRPVLLLALAGYTITCAGYATAESPTGLIAFRLLQGLSSGFFSVAARSLIGDLCASNRRGTAQGIYSSSVNLGFCIGPVVGSVTARYMWISAPFWIAAALSLVSLLVLITVPIRVPASPTAPERTSSPGLRTRGALRPWRYRRINLLVGSNFAFFAGLSVIMTLFPIAGESEIRGGVIAVGASITASGLFGLLFGPLTGRLSDMHGRSRLMFFGAILAACEGGVLLLTRSPWIIGVGFAMGGIGTAAFINSFHAAIGDLSVERTRGVITGFAGLARESGGIAGSLLAPWLWSMTDLRYPFGLQILFTGLVVALVFWFSRYKTSRPSHPAKISEAVVSS